MATPTPSIEFFDGISETLEGVSLRRRRDSGVRIVQMTFHQVKSIEEFRSFRNQFSKAMNLIDSEGTIQVEPSSVKFYFGGPEGDDLERMECTFELDRDDHWERFKRFMDRYAAANGMEYGEPSQPVQEDANA